MQCFMCYLLVWGITQAADIPDQRSLFHDVLHSLLIPTTEHQFTAAPRGNRPPHRLPKAIHLTNKPSEQKTTQPTATSRPKLPSNKNKLQNLFNKTPLTNTMGGGSHIGNVRSQSVVKPTIILNIKGTSNNIESRCVNRPVGKDEVLDPLFNNEYNINQRIKFEGFMEKGDTRSPLKQSIVYDFKG